MGKKLLYVSFRVNKKVLAAIFLVAAVFATAFTVSAVTAEPAMEIPIVMYHSVLEDETRHGKYVISPNEFESDVEYLENHGYTTVLIEDLINYTKGGTLPEKPIVLTFDDGYYNNYLYAYKIAKAHNVRFVISPIGSCAELYSQNEDKNAYYSHATWEQLKEMADSGLVEVQNHSYDLHKNENGVMGIMTASGESDTQYRARISSDLLKAQNAIEKNIGVRPTAMVYPFGAVSKTSPEIVRSLGFSATLTCEERKSKITHSSESLYGLGRYLRPSGISSEEFFAQKMHLAESSAH